MPGLETALFGGLAVSLLAMSALVLVSVQQLTILTKRLDLIVGPSPVRTHFSLSS